MRSKKDCLVFAILVSTFFSVLSFGIVETACAKICSPVAQLVDLSELKSHSILFLGTQGEPAVKSAAINTPACLAAKYNFSRQSYSKLQELDAAATSSVAIIASKGFSEEANCLLEINSSDEFFRRRWRFEEDECSQHPIDLISMISIDGRTHYYVNAALRNILSVRTPANLKKKVK